MPFGSVFSKLARFRLDAADGQVAEVTNNFVMRSALAGVGVPHMGLRIRAGLVMDAVASLRPESIVDAGSGNGLYTLELASRGYPMTGLEIDQAKVHRVNDYLNELGLSNAQVLEHDLTGETPAVSADLVVCSDVLEHIEADKSAIASLRKLVQPGGYLVLTVPRVSEFASRVENSFDHVRVGYLAEELQPLLEAVGFEVLEQKTFFKQAGRMAWAADRALRKVPPLRALLFWPLFVISKLDALLPDDADAGGLFIVARAVDHRIGS